jgi:N-acetylglucosaminyl-diphospho-decaprenol L-rhamnosyltransferase
MPERLPVVAAIPNYNMADGLATLLPKVLEQNYDDVFVLDDVSSDHSREVVDGFGTDVNFVAGDRNRGAGANRNRIIPHVGEKTIIHFMDADTEPISADMPDAARAMVENPEIGFAGGLVRGEDGLQHFWNYGPRMSLYTHLHAPLQEAAARLAPNHPEMTWYLREALRGYLRDFPNPFEPAAERPTFWVIESNLVIRGAHFAALKGFDGALREHEVQDLAIRSANRGLKARFNPSIEILQRSVDVRGYDRQKAMRRAEAYIIQKHNPLQWLRPDGHFKPSE